MTTELNNFKNKLINYKNNNDSEMINRSVTIHFSSPTELENNKKEIYRIFDETPTDLIFSHYCCSNKGIMFSKQSDIKK